MAVKSYAGKFNFNWDELSPERLSEIETVWNDSEAERTMRRIRQYPAWHQEAIFNAVIEQLKITAS